MCGRWHTLLQQREALEESVSPRALTPFQPFGRTLLVSVSAPLTQRASLVCCSYQKRQKPSSSVPLLFTLPLFLSVSRFLPLSLSLPLQGRQHGPPTNPPFILFFFLSFFNSFFHSSLPLPLYFSLSLSLCYYYLPHPHTHTLSIFLSPSISVLLYFVFPKQPLVSQPQLGCYGFLKKQSLAVGFLFSTEGLSGLFSILF